MRLAMGQRGATIVTLGIAVSTLGFLSQSILTASAGVLRNGGRRRLLSAGCEGE